MNPFTRLVASKLPNQYHKHALEVDSHLRVLGAPLGTVYCIGDAATIETNLVNHLWELVEYCDVNREWVSPSYAKWAAIWLSVYLLVWSAARLTSMNLKLCLNA